MKQRSGSIFWAKLLLHYGPMELPCLLPALIAPRNARPLSRRRCGTLCATAWQGRLDMRPGLGSSWCFGSLEAQGASTLQTLAIFHRGIFWEDAIKESGPASRHREGFP